MFGSLKEESRFSKFSPSSEITSLKLIAAAVSAMIIISSVAIIEVTIQESDYSQMKSNSIYQTYQTRTCEVKTVISQAGTWVSFDSTPVGTPAETHMIVSDTTGIIVVADFHGFWKNTFTLDGTGYDDLDMPGAYSLNDPENPKVPVLFEYVEVPHDVDISIEVLAFSNSTITGYSIRPSSYPYAPAGEGTYWDSSAIKNFTGLPTSLGSVYSDDAFFPGIKTRISGGNNQNSIIIRGHRLLGLDLFPVQFNPLTNTLIVFSQLVIKVKYSEPAQIEPIPVSLRSEVFEQILEDSLLYYDPINKQDIRPGIPTSYSRIPISPAPMPNVTVPMLPQASQVESIVGAEYLIITGESLGYQANRLAAWKEQKGIPSEVVTIDEPVSSENVRSIIEFAYNNWCPAPTYVLLFGDVNIIPTNYDMIHPARISWFQPYYPEGYIASDLGYFNIQGHSYFPDIIYSRISVDSEEQAGIIVDKILNYEKNPPESNLFYNNMLSAGTFEDWNDNDGYEDEGTPFISTLENIRYFLEGELDYVVHYNYSCPANQNRHIQPIKFLTALDYGQGTNIVADYIPSDYDWLWAYDNKRELQEVAAANITASFNQGCFLVMYYSHGGSKNMVYPVDWYPYDKRHDGQDRDFVEGWVSPFFNTSDFSGLTNGNELPLVLSLACNAGWFDGETDQQYLHLYGQNFDHNPFLDYENDCFAENLTRLRSGGAIAVIAPSRISYAKSSGDLLVGIIQSFWPEFLESGKQPLYQMGAALFSSKLQVAGKWLNHFSIENVARTTYEIYHLFGDPETQLWTHAPSEFAVTHPSSIGTSDPQKFVVTVRDYTTNKPIDYAKVCVQQDPYVYEVGYTDRNGQIIFTIDPPDSSAYLNVTVTKHNYKPYINTITVKKSYNARVTVNPSIGLYGDSVRIYVTGFDDGQVVVYFDGLEMADFPNSVGSVSVQVPEGVNRYVNVVAEQENTNTLTTTWFCRLSTDQNPDPYIYSYKDTSTWYLANDELVWDNPCITIYEGTNLVKRVTQNRLYIVNVTIYNRGNGDAVDTDVTLSYAPFGGGVTWWPIDTKTVTIPLFESRELSFEWTPVLPNTACLSVTIDQSEEKPEDIINNVGYECWNIIPTCSQGQSIFQVGNPSDNAEYVFIKVRQEGIYDDVWLANLQDHSYQVMRASDTETVTLFVDPSGNLEFGEGRLFTTEIYINGELIGGMATTIECQQNIQWILFIIILAVVIIALIIWYKRRNK